MKQYYHELSAYIGMRKSGKGKEFKDISAGVGMPDSFRAWIGRDGTHHTLGSWWRIEEPHKLKRARKEDIQKQYYYSSEANKAKEEKWCVDGLTDFTEFIKANKKLFNDVYKDKYGFPILLHLLQDFYTDIVWRVIYNFEHQEEVILKTEKKVIIGNQEVDGINNLTPQYPEYHLLDNTLEESRQRFRREYKIMNEYATYLLLDILQKEGIEYDEKKENQIRRSFNENYPQEIANTAKNYIKIPNNIRDAINGDSKQKEIIENEAKQILGENMHLFRQMNINCIKAVAEAKRLSEKLNQILYHSKNIDKEKQIESIMGKQISINSAIQTICSKVYSKHSQGEELQR